MITGLDRQDSLDLYAPEDLMPRAAQIALETGIITPVIRLLLRTGTMCPIVLVNRNTRERRRQMTENPHVDELNRAADRLAGVITKLSQVLERMQEIQRASLPSEVTGSMQPQLKVPLLSGGNDPTLADRFEEELHRRSVKE